MTEQRRLGDVAKCPACGTQVDGGAYHCPQCRTYFCFHCRVRMVKSDEQFQCTNQSCGYHGKLLCGNCDPEAKRDEPPSVYSEVEDGWWPFLLLAGIILVVVLLFYMTFWAAVGVGLGAAALAGLILQRVGVNIFGKENRIVQPRATIFHTCISCQQPAKALRV